VTPGAASGWLGVVDVAGMVCLAAGACLSLAAAVGLLRFPDLLSRLHAGAKPQVLGLFLVLLGVGLRLRSEGATAVLVLVAIFQMFTVPVGTYMAARSAHRSGQARREDLAVDELTD
jgi:multicomponent Na+:H+ antiporter subunit G